MERSIGVARTKTTKHVTGKVAKTGRFVAVKRASGHSVERVTQVAAKTHRKAMRELEKH